VSSCANVMCWKALVVRALAVVPVALEVVTMAKAGISLVQVGRSWDVALGLAAAAATASVPLSWCLPCQAWRDHGKIQSAWRTMMSASGV
jgi:hypothetical protein